MKLLVILREIAHHLLPIVGIILTVQAPLTTLLVAHGESAQLIDLSFGVLGALMTATSKHIDSSSYTAIQAASNSVIAPAGNSSSILGSVASDALAVVSKAVDAATVSSATVHINNPASVQVAPDTSVTTPPAAG